MAWVVRGCRRYYYRSRRVGGRVRGQYIGVGPVAELMARADALTRAVRRARARALQDKQVRWTKAEAPLLQLDRLAGLLVAAALAAAGYHRHDRGHWRKRRTPMIEYDPQQQASPGEGVPPQLLEVLQRAEQGDATVLPQLQRALDAHPEVWRRYGDLATRAREVWVRMAAGDNLLLREALERRLAELEAELQPEGATPLEGILIGRVVASWLQVAHADLVASQSGSATPAVQAQAMRNQGSAQRRLLEAVRQLTTVRKLLRPALPPPSPGLRLVGGAAG
jgi:hypothetical protein